MAAAVHDALAFVAYPGDAGVDMFLEDAHLPRHAACGQVLTVVEVVTDLLEEPGVAEGGAAYHHRVHAVAVETFFGAFGRGDVAVADDGDMHAGVVLDLADECPVGFAGVHLAARAAVDSEGLDSAVLQLFGQRDDDLVVVVPAEARLDGHGDTDCVDHGAGDFQHLGDIPQESCAGTFARHFLDGAAEVDVEVIGVRLLHDLRCGGHRLGIFAVDLYGHGSFSVGYLQLAHGGSHVAYECVGVDKLGIDAVGSEALAQQAERGVGDVLHRRQVQRSGMFVGRIHIFACKVTTFI